MPNGVMLQYFHWYIRPEDNLWLKFAEDAKFLADLGITAVWFPPAYKGMNGINSVGYDVYDMYDLGEFFQKGTVRTKYGTKDEYLLAIEHAHKYNIQVYADIVFNHRAGADFKERVYAQKVDPANRNIKIGQPRVIEAWTKFIFPGRIKFNEKLEIIDYKYSDFIWDYLCFDGVDWDEKQKEQGIFLFLKYNETWDQVPDDELGNYDYLMFADLDINFYEVQDELKKWGLWYLNFTNVDGFRLDAIKHISIDFFNEWLDFLRKETGKELFTVGEYWHPHRVDLLERYLQKCNFRISLFDAPLQNKFHQISQNPQNIDLASVFNETLVSKHPMHAVTLVDNHDTQPLQALEAPVEPWFKPIAYAFILLRRDGYPCVFYPDIYGAKYVDKGRDGNFYEINLSPVKELPLLLKARKLYNYGEQIDYFDFYSTVGWVRLGSENSKPMAVVASIGNEDGYKDMYVGEKHANEMFFDYLGNYSTFVRIGTNGIGRFYCKKKSVSVWVPVE